MSMKPLAGHGKALGLRGQLMSAVACAGQATAAMPAWCYRLEPVAVLFQAPDAHL